MRTLACAFALLLVPSLIIAQPHDLAAAKREYEAARGQPDKQATALKAIANIGSADALKFLLEELRTDQRARPEGAAKTGLLPARVRRALLEGLAAFSDENGIKALDSEASALDSAKNPQLALNQLDLFEPMARMKKPGADKALRAALTHKQNAYIKCAAMEALRRARRADFVDDVIAVIGEKNKLWLTDGRIVMLNALDFLREVAGKDNASKVVEALLALVEWVATQRKLELDARTLFFAQRALEAVSGEKASLKSVEFWKWWLLQQKNGGNAQPRPPANPERATGTAFDVELVGHRIVYIIDVSSSMNEPLPDALKKDDRFSKCGSKLALARQELAASIKRLPPDRKFAVALYSKDAEILTNGWVEASPANVELWAKRASEVDAKTITNIHGAMLAGLRISDTGTTSTHPSVDKDAVATGADAFVLLTDGWATWSDDSTAYDAPEPRGGQGNVGNGKFIIGEEIALDILRVNAFRKVIINTVGIGNHDRELLQSLARETGGGYVDWGGK